MEKLIESSLVGRVLVLTFHDAKSRNSFSLRAAEELEAHLATALSAPEIAGLVFTTKGRVFCSGGNLSDYAAMERAEQGKAVNRRITAILDKLEQFERPTVCAVGGDCFGGGVELIGAFDVVIATPQSFFGLWQRKIGLSFGWGGGKRLERRLGEATLRQLVLSGESLPAADGLKLGLIDEIVPETQLMQRALARVEALSALPKTPVGALKTWTSEKEQEIFESLWWNDEHRAVLARRRS